MTVKSMMLVRTDSGQTATRLDREQDCCSYTAAQHVCNPSPGFTPALGQQPSQRSFKAEPPSSAIASHLTVSVCWRATIQVTWSRIASIILHGEKNNKMHRPAGQNLFYCLFFISYCFISFWIYIMDHLLHLLYGGKCINIISKIYLMSLKKIICPAKKQYRENCIDFLWSSWILFTVVWLWSHRCEVC